MMALKNYKFYLSSIKLHVISQISSLMKENTETDFRFERHRDGGTVSELLREPTKLKI